MVAIAVRRLRVADLLVLAKARIAIWVLFTVAAGFIMAAVPGTQGLLLPLLIGTSLVVVGTNALNQVAEVETDGLMRRTRSRPLPAGRLPVGAVALGAGLSGTIGIAYLAVSVNGLTAALAALTLVSYVFIYTPLKRRSTLNTLVGAVPGALPIVGGYAASTGRLDAPAAVLFLVMFLWQMPHFLALSWLYREDYGRAGIKMLAVRDPSGRVTFAQSLLYAAALVPVALLPTMLGMAGQMYFWGALVLSLAYCGAALVAALRPTEIHARRLFFLSIWYLPALLTLMMVDIRV